MAFTLPDDLATDFVDNSSTVNAAYFNGVSAMGNAIKAALGTIGYGTKNSMTTASETTTSTSYADLTTTTDQVTVAVGSSGKVWLTFGAQMTNSGANYSYVAVDVSGANTIAAGDTTAIQIAVHSGGVLKNYGNSLLLTGLTAGDTTFKLKYKVNAGTGTFANRRISVIPMPSTDGTHAADSFNLAATPALSMSGKGYNWLTIMGSNVANTTSVTIPAHEVGDLIVIFAKGLTTAVTKPAASGTVPAWVDVDSASGSYTSTYTARFVATATNHTSGTWANATAMAAVVLRNADGTTPIGGHAISAASATGNTCPGVDITMSRRDGTSKILEFYGWGDGVNAFTSVGTTPSGHTQQVKGEWSGNKTGVALNTRNDTTSDGAVAHPSSSGCWSRGAAIEVIGPAYTTLPAFDAVGAGTCGTSANGGTYSETHVLAADATTICVAAMVGAGAANKTITATIGDTAINIPQVYQRMVYSTTWQLVVFALQYPPTGSQAINLILPAGTNYSYAVNSISYTGVGSIGTAESPAAAGSTPATQTITGMLSTKLFHALGAANNGAAAFSSYNKTQRAAISGATNSCSTPLVIGDMDGAASVTVSATATGTGTYNWGSIILPLRGF